MNQHNAECEWCHKPLVIAHAEEGMTYAFCSSECEIEFEKEQNNIESQSEEFSNEQRKAQNG